MNKSDDLRVAVISTCSPYDLYLIQQIANHFNLCGIIRPVPGQKPGRKLNWRNFLKRPLAMISAKLNMVFIEYFFRRSNANALRVLFGDTPPALESTIIDIPAWAINDPDSVLKISRLKPDVIVVSGAPVLKPEVIRIAERTCLNVHYGISPEYRGEHCLFWPLQLGDYDNIGTTIHHVAEAIDSGKTIGRGFLQIAPDDTEDSISVKCSILAAGMIITILQHLDRYKSGREVESESGENKGRFIRYRDRKIWHNLRFAFKRHILGHRLPDKPERIDWFLPDASSRAAMGPSEPA